MKKVTYTVLFLLGLVFQPYVGLVSASIHAVDGENMSGSMDMNYSAAEMDADYTAKPCQEMAQDNNRCCDIGCFMSAHCTSYCASLSLTAIDTQQIGLDSFHQTDLKIVARSIAYFYRQSFYIYHPPKYIHSV